MSMDMTPFVACGPGYNIQTFNREGFIMASNYIVHAWPVVPASGYAGPQDYMFGPYNEEGAERVSRKCNEANYDTEIVELVSQPATMITDYKE